MFCFSYLPPMHSFVVRLALRQHVPLRACVENPQYRFKYTTRRSRFAPRTSIANILLRKMIPDAFPLLTAIRLTVTSRNGARPRGRLRRAQQPEMPMVGFPSVDSFCAIR